VDIAVQLVETQSRQQRVLMHGPNPWFLSALGLPGVNSGVGTVTRYPSFGFTGAGFSFKRSTALPYLRPNNPVVEDLVIYSMQGYTTLLKVRRMFQLVYMHEVTQQHTHDWHLDRHLVNT